MKPGLFNGRLLIALTAFLLDGQAVRTDAAPADPADASDRSEGALAIPTFHCLGLYWSPEGGATDKQVAVRYRRQGANDWNEGLPMRYNPIPGTDEDLTDYRGSIVHLEPATEYEVELALAGTQQTTRLTATTWSGDFPVGETVCVADRDAPLAVTESGTPEAWRLYDGRGATIDVRHQYIFHNTLFASDQWLPTGGLGGNRIVKHTVSRNNILHVRSPDNRSISEAEQNVDNDFDYDLYNSRVPHDQEAHGIRDEPVYAAGAGFDPASNTGRFQLAPSSPGTGAGQPLPNFSQGYTGPAPDVGAHQRGAPPMRYGVGARTSASLTGS